MSLMFFCVGCCSSCLVSDVPVPICLPSLVNIYSPLSLHSLLASYLCLSFFIIASCCSVPLTSCRLLSVTLYLHANPHQPVYDSVLPHTLTFLVLPSLTVSIRPPPRQPANKTAQRWARRGPHGALHIDSREAKEPGCVVLGQECCWYPRRPVQADSLHTG